MLRLVNAAVFTARADRLWTEAVAVDRGRVVGAGTIDAVRQASPGAVELDLAGRTVLPGLIDAHNHFLSTGEALGAVDVRSLTATTKATFLDTLAEAASRLAPGALITATGFDPTKYVDGAPDRYDLDRVVPQHRVLAYHVSGHGALASTSLLRDAGVDDTTPDPDGGRFVRDAAGRLTGLCLDTALQVLAPVAVDIGRHGPNFHTSATAADLRTALLRAQRAYLQAGLTAVCDAQVTSRELAAYQSARQAGSLLLRTVCMPLSHQLDDLVRVGVSTGFGDARLQLGPMKFYADGTLLGGTALLSAPYGCDGRHRGHLFRPAAELRADVVRAVLAGWRIGIHVQGDEAIGQVLDTLESAADAAGSAAGLAAGLAAGPGRDLRPRLEHAGLPTRAHLGRMAALGAVTVNQPSYLHEMGDQLVDDLGDRAHRLQPLRDELEAGVRVCISSDSDVASYRPLDTVAAAIYRTSSGGQVLGPDQRLTLDQALLAHTIDAAYAIGRESDLGSLAAGKRADLTVLDGDLRGLGAAGDGGSGTGDQIRALRVWATMIEGEWVYGDEVPAGPGRVT